MRVRVSKRGESYQVTAIIGHDERGKEIRRTYTRRTKREAEAFASDLRRQAALNTYSPDSRTTVAAFAAQWLAGKGELSANTRDQYDQMLRLHILPELEGVKLAQVGPAHVQQLVAAVADKGLAPKTVRHAFTTLRAMLGQAVKWRLIGSNPCALVDAPRLPRQEAAAWNAEQAAAYLAALEGEPLYPLFYLTLKTGMRRGEVLGLRWADLDGNRLRVVRAVEFRQGRPVIGEVKTTDSLRTIVLAPSTLAVLRDYARQMKEHNLSAGKGRLAFDHLMFASRNGTPIQPSTLYRAHAKAIERAGLPPLTIHGLRHTTATILLSQGMPLLTVSRLLGHADIQTTANVYGHITAQMEEQAAVAMDTALAAAEHSPQNLYTRRKK